MKIAYITSVYGRSSDTFIRNEVLGLRDRGHEVYTFSIRRESGQGELSIDVASEQSTTDYILEKPLILLIYSTLLVFICSPLRMCRAILLAWKTHIPGIKGLFNQCAYLLEASYLTRRMGKLGIDILHNHIAENSANVAMLASLLSNVPFSMTVHGPGIFFHPKQWVLGEKVARSAFTATITNFCRSQCMLFTDTKYWHKLHIIRCAVGKDFESPSTIPISEAPRLVFVGRLCAEKGMQILIQAVTKLVESEFSLELILIGDGPMRSEIEALIKQKNLGSVIQILGAKSSSDVRNEIKQSRALVLPSFAEGLPVVIMEAFALGRPVVATQIAGIPELVVNGVNGWLVPPGSVECLEHALIEVITTRPSVLQQMGLEGAGRVQEFHKLSNELDKLECLLKSAVYQ
ncbi:glycosyltransferase [Methylomonas sp. AM2-LC]|uniref:glycosyltransferase n=1 Tax=Methylomonas sp. AM2-LC TaxID=3153301 RepID=UPI003265ECBB